MISCCSAAALQVGTPPHNDYTNRVRCSCPSSNGRVKEQSDEKAVAEAPRKKGRESQHRCTRGRCAEPFVEEIWPPKIEIQYIMFCSISHVTKFVSKYIWALRLPDNPYHSKLASSLRELTRPCSKASLSNVMMTVRKGEDGLLRSQTLILNRRENLSKKASASKRLLRGKLF